MGNAYPEAMSPRSKKTSALMRARTREAILSSALELFAKRGFSATTTAEIAERAGISKGLIFTHFTTKESILLAIFEEQIDRILPRFVQEPIEGLPEERLMSLVSAWVELIRTEPLLIRLSLHLNLDEAYRRLIRTKKWKQYIDLLLTQIRAILKDLGSDRPELDAFMLMFMVDGIIANYTVAPDMFPPLDEVTQHLVRVLTYRWGRSGRTKKVSRTTENEKGYR
jgi:AcrR family transcriptional regulator